MRAFCYKIRIQTQTRRHYPNCSVAMIHSYCECRRETPDAYPNCSVAMIPSPTTDALPSKPTTYIKRAQQQKTAVQVVHHTLCQHLTTRQPQLPTTNPIPKLALDYRNHCLHLPTLTIEIALLRTRHQRRTQHATPCPHEFYPACGLVHTASCSNPDRSSLSRHERRSVGSPCITETIG